MSEDGNEKNVNSDWRLGSNDWVVGIALILAGGLFLLDSFNIVNIHLTNWWAVFILIPGINMIVNGWQRYQQTGSISSRNSALWGFLLILLAFSFFFNIAWEMIFPVALIGVGAYLLLARR